jgi:hypothetical protein
MVDELFFLKEFERLSERVAVLEAAQAAPVAPPTPESDAEPDAALSTPEPDEDSIDRLAAIIRKVDVNHDLSADGLAEAILWDPDAAAVFPLLGPGSVVAGLPDTSHLAPPPWPELPEEPPNSWLANHSSPDYREGRRVCWLAARKCLADMNPNRQGEGRDDG